MSIYQLKSAFQSLLRPTVVQLAKLGVTANSVTLTAMLLSIALGVLLVCTTVAMFNLHNLQLVWLLLPVWLFLRMALNAIDGMLAREHQQKSHLGAILNEVGDVVSDLALSIPFVVLAWRFDDLVATLLMCSVLLVALLTEFIGVLGPMLGASRRYDGPLGKSDRAFMFGAVALAYGLGWISAGVTVLSWVFGVALLLSLLTCWNRIRAMLAEVNHA
ncbi:CDP-alcohol phosphatidyltransferase family protein [Chitinibacter fontanus]|uniref:CDP-alcohol phosphatidyltransferase family protein n=1 Tax=Chitinibacter fontanus TaxID=1737446 RepID=A0A7D5V980_9NEIS|nr:CDP-alcohol phosphatidyltransferase family protein [Chitinibacter fontanus]QLI80972.1 CDP-alcohol phosphatidyltransferase family protein [Chitinibacter fontanus]